MVISSLIVETTPSHTSEVAQALACCDGVEVHEINGCKIIVTIEAQTVEASHDRASSFITYQGVLAVDLIYVNFEDDPTFEVPFETPLSN